MEFRDDLYYVAPHIMLSEETSECVGYSIRQSFFGQNEDILNLI